MIPISSSPCDSPAVKNRSMVPPLNREELPNHSEKFL
jgi:hypothetical protein